MGWQRYRNDHYHDLRPDVRLRLRNTDINSDLGTTPHLLLGISVKVT